MKNNIIYKEYIAPVVVLVTICLVITFALAFTYSVSEPIIISNTAKLADQARTELLSNADSFTPYNGKLVVTEKDKVFVSDCYVADNGAGMVVTVKSKSFGGLLTEMIGIDNKGAITGVKVTAHSDTPGLGTKAQTPTYLGQYVGLSKLGTKSVKTDPDVTYISGASITSDAVHYGVYCALEQYKEVGGAK